MAPLPDNNTPVVFVDYADASVTHTLQWRYNQALSSAEQALARIVDFFEALDPVLYQIFVTGARVRPESSVISMPITWPGASTYGAGDVPLVNVPREIRFIGRSEDGRRVSWSMYDFIGVTPENYRIMEGDIAGLDNAIAVLRAASADLDVVTISSISPIIYPYVDFNFNSYWERQRRG